MIDLNRYQPLAEKVVEVLDWVMVNELKINPPEMYELGCAGDRVALVASFDPLQMGRSANVYENKDTIKRLRQALDGLPLVRTRRGNLKYVVMLNGLPRLPRMVALPETTTRGLVMIGVKHNSKVIQKPWSQLGHICVVGKTDSGKSGGLRLFAYQAIRDGFLLAIADNDRATFSMLQNHPNLIAPIAADAEAAFQLIERVSAECDSRAATFQSISGQFPETMEEYNTIAVPLGHEALKPILVILDELSNTIILAGPKQKRLMDMLGALGMRARKFGIKIIFAAHEFTKEMLGMIRPQCETFIAYRNDAVEMSRLLGCAGAERIPQNHKGMMVTNKWGRLQTFYLDKSRLGDGQAQGQPIPEEEAALVRRSFEQAGGKFSFELLMSWGLSDTAARELGGRYEARGWATKDPRRSNARYLTPKLLEMITNPQTAQTATNPEMWQQTATNPTQTPDMGMAA